MAIILNLENQKQTLTYLNAYHCIGRSTTNVDTVINSPEVSRTHAIIEWTNEQWFIRDISNNGTWLNNQKLIKDQPYKIKVGDTIFLTKVESHGFMVKDIAPPQNMLLYTDEDPIFLTDYNILPSKQQPEIALFYVPSKDQWYKEFMDDATGKAFPVTNLDLVLFNNKNWQLKLNINSENTIHLAKPKLLAHQIKYRFNLSQDEENTELNITTEDGEFSLSSHAHHYLTLSLARHRDEDAKKGVDEYNQGWILPEILADELGCDIPLLNTHVCRAKQQFIEKLKGACDGDELIERKGNKIRFSGSFFRIYQGSKLIVNSEQRKMPFMVLHG